MTTKKANTLTKAQLEIVWNYVNTRPHSVVDRARVALSFKAGLRAQEIAGLRWDRNVLDATGDFRSSLFVGSDIGKYGQERFIPWNKDLITALRNLRKAGYPGNLVIPPLRPGASTAIQARANAMAVWFWRTYDNANLKGCSSHSGRRTVITTLAKNCNKHGGSLRDVQKIAGHAYINTTQLYIEESDAQKNMMGDL